MKIAFDNNEVLSILGRYIKERYGLQNAGKMSIAFRDWNGRDSENSITEVSIQEAIIPPNTEPPSGVESTSTTTVANQDRRIDPQL